MKTFSFQFLFIFMLFPLLIFAQPKENNNRLNEAKAILYDDPNKAIAISQQLLKTEKQPDQMADLYILISTAYHVKRDLDNSLLYIEKAKSLLDSDSKIETKVKILNFIAIQYRQMGLYEKALETLDNAEEYNSKLPEGNAQKNNFSAIFNASRGMIYRKLGHLEMAIEKLTAAEKFFQLVKGDAKNDGNISIVYYSLGYCHLDLHQYNKAEQNFKAAQQFGASAQSPRLQSFALKGLADYFCRTKNYLESVEALSKANHLAAGSKDLSLKEGIYGLMAKSYYGLGDLDQYSIYHQKTMELTTEQKTTELKSLNKFIDNNTAEIEIKTEKIQRNYLLYQITIIGITLVLFALILHKILTLRKLNRRQFQ